MRGISKSSQQGIVIALVLVTAQAWASPTDLCLRSLNSKEKKESLYKQELLNRFGYRRAEVQPLKIDMPGLEIASLTDATGATGATLFYFGKSVVAAYDSRGGSVAAVETTLLDSGSYDPTIDGIVFAGGSIMGLEATTGVRKHIFNERSRQASSFDFIPSVPGAVVYDFSGRTELAQDPLVYPDREMGEALFLSKKPGEFLLGRAGAGTSTTANKVSEPIFSGQGAAVMMTPYGRVFVAVALNPAGNVMFTRQGLAKTKAQRAQPGHNTTLSIVITEQSLDRNALKRLATSVHTSMARFIHPFHTYTDGDIMFAVSLGRKDPPVSRLRQDEAEEEITAAAYDLIGEAIRRSVLVANGLPF